MCCCSFNHQLMCNMTALFSLIIFVLSVVTCAVNKDNERAEVFHGQALELVRQDLYDLGLAHFRAACRWNNQSALYWNDLGVTEMRMGQYTLARKRFLKALSIDPGFELALQNIEDLEFFTPTSPTLPSQPSTGENRRHTIMSPRELSHDEFLLLNSALSDYPNSAAHHEFIRTTLSEPFIVKNAFPLFNITNNKLEAIFNRKFLTTTYGHNRVDFYPHNMLVESAHPYFLNLGSALQQLIYKPEEVYVGVDASEPGTYVQWNLDHTGWREILRGLDATLPSMLNDTIWAEHCFQKRSVSSVSSSVASSIESVDGNVVSDIEHTTSSHYAHTTTTTTTSTSATSTTSSATTSTSTTTTALDTATLSQFYLSTHWQMLLLAETSAGMFLHKDTLRTASWQLQLVGRKKWHICSDTNTPYLYKAGDVDMFSIDYTIHPLVLHAQCYEVVLSPGEVVYYPGDFWHQTVNLDTPSIAASSTLVTPYNYKHVTGELRTECSDTGMQRIFAYNEGMCSALELCYTHWNSLYSGV